MGFRAAAEERGNGMVKCFDSLTEAAKQIREEVFVEEQGFQREFDETDSRAVHLVWYEAGEAAATCRYYAGEEKGVYWLGRLAVRKRFRGRQIGGKLLFAAEEEIRRDKDPPVLPGEGKGILCEMWISCFGGGIQG